MGNREGKETERAERRGREGKVKGGNRAVDRGGGQGAEKKNGGKQGDGAAPGGMDRRDWDGGEARREIGTGEKGRGKKVKGGERWLRDPDS